ncbi:hypothetical protein AVEN_121280-1 [Araneus ventricosus]|uniref:Uncharacterized protein n=1 Tax=Araneus ventricosus TaxID=182803 RepID=A0A4Y2SME7_ARAVE|nr:hypothetical protein AVEN_121280-1 [Araneus ventricosus]
MSLSQNFWNSTLWENWLPSTGVSSSTFPLAVRTPSLRCRVPKSPVSFGYLRGLSERFLAKMVRSANFFSRIGLIAGSSSCAFWISHEDQGSTVVVVVTTFTEISLSVNFSRRIGALFDFLYKVFGRELRFH